MNPPIEDPLGQSASTAADVPTFPVDPNEVDTLPPAVNGDPEPKVDESDPALDFGTTEQDEDGSEYLELWTEPVPVLQAPRRRRSSGGSSSNRSGGARRNSHRSTPVESISPSPASPPPGPDTPADRGEGSGGRRRMNAEERARLRRRRQIQDRVAYAVVALASAAAVVAPATLTGHRLIDIVERVFFAALVSFTSAHGRRWSWVVAGGLILVPARGPALVLVLVAMVVAAFAATRQERSKPLGAAIGGLLANAALWYSSDLPPGVAAGFALAGASFLIVSGYRSMRPKPKRLTRMALVPAIAVFLIAVAGVVAGGLMTMSDLTSGGTAARKALSQVEAGDTESATLSLEAAGDHLDRADSVLSPTTLAARLVPALAQQVRALDVSLTESRRITRAADDLLATTDYDKLRYQGRIDVDQLERLAPGARNIEAVLTQAGANLDRARSVWLVPPLRDQVDELSMKIAEVHKSSELAGDVLEVAPGLFGGEGDRRYLVVFVTPAELRGGGGFVGSYAELTAIDGRLDMARSGPIRDLIYHGEFGERKITGPDDYINRYGRFTPADYVQDATYSPNFPSNAKVLAELYPQAGGSAVDGVIGVDPAGLAAVLRLTGPVSVEGYDQVLNADNAEELLLREQYVKFDDGEEDGGASADGGPPLEDRYRKDFLAEATKATFAKLTSASLPSPSEIGRVLGPAARGRHLQVWSPLVVEQQLFERIDADSSLDIPRGFDGFELAENNAGNNKLDAYLRREISYSAQVDPTTGRVSSTLKVTLHNEVPLPLSALPVSVWGNRSKAEGGTNVTWLSLFTPHRVRSATIDGQPVDLTAEEEVGLNAYDTPFFEIPQGKTVTVEIRLEGVVDLTDGYNLRIVPQPVANPDRLSVDVTPARGAMTGDDTTRGGIHLDKPMVDTVDLGAEVE
ncbi:MAG: DUF4012 domain-containing protein [Microthrixaceae bacterium]|nr:DUF4012 domain-containing protein [Acidimicrobiales bacterium]MCB9404852.1 DUF4012 domain-containing protein [Microthrixaceae bacterium]